MSDLNRNGTDQPQDSARSSALRAEAERHSHRFHPDQPTGSLEPEVPRRFRLRKLKWILRGLLLLAILIAALFFIPRIKAFFSPKIDFSAPDSLSGLLPDETMGYNKIDFSNAILGESREKSDFVVLEQDVTVTSRVSQALANLALFEKSQVIRSYGTGVYTVDLSKLSAKDVTVDEALSSVAISIPHAALAYVTVDLEKTEYEETKKALFAFGEIKLTGEQANLLEQNIEDSMREQLAAEEMLQKADAHALSQVQALFDPIVKSVASNYIVVVVFGS
ncbi:MAG: DUF4230 domain-containing protein [Eubacteriales bacterium]|nr:DUF4230 domain-containing protein [Eubacteriales bacterium]